MTKLALEVGKTYIRRDGSGVKITGDERAGPAFDCYRFKGGDGNTYRVDGRVLPNMEHSQDLVSEKVSEGPSGFEISAQLKVYIDSAVAQALQGAPKPPEAAATVPEVPERERSNLAVIAQAKLEGRSLQYRADGFDKWGTSFNPSPGRFNFTYRIKPEPVVVYLGMAKGNPHSNRPVLLGSPKLSRPNVVESRYPTPDKVIVLKIDPDTLEIISCVAEAP